jgi:hypothetical protein
MNMNQRLLAVATVMLLATGGAWGNANCEHSRSWQCGSTPAQAPEIDAASGTSAIALLTGIVLLMKERRRSKRSSKSDE